MNKMRTENEERKRGSVQLLLVGHSTEHILKVMQEFYPIHVDLFTSLELESEVIEFMMSLVDYNGTYLIQVIPSFTEESLITGISVISSRYYELKKKFPREKIYFGVTGGTNPMAVEMAIAAIISEESMHYVIKGVDTEEDHNKVIIYDTGGLREFIKNGNVRRID